MEQLLEAPVAKQLTKIPILKYTEVNDASQTNGVVFGSDTYIVTENEKQYIVEVWA